MISYRLVEKESDELLCTVWSLVTVRNQRKWLKTCDTQYSRISL